MLIGTSEVVVEVSSTLVVEGLVVEVSSNSVLDVVQQGTPEMRVKLGNAIAVSARKTALGVVAGAAVNIEILVVARDGQINGTAGTITP